ncbi:MAG TPA: YceI family protein [Dehalococcoidia bacterium]|nr:YceI family protein [Dehalococcoidia bacterium]
MKRFGFIFMGMAGGFAVVGIMLAASFFMRSGAGAAPDLETSAPPIPIAEAPTEVEAAPAAPPTPVESHFAIDPAQSSAKLFVTETILFSDSVVVANASNVTGNVFLMPDGSLGPSQSAIQLDLRTFKSSDSFLDSFLKGDTFKPFPTAEFIMASASGIPQTYTDGNEFRFTVTGPLTLRGITREVTFTAKGKSNGEFLSVVADTDFLMTDFGITPPNYGLGKAKNQVHLQVLFLGAKAE